MDSAFHRRKAGDRGSKTAERDKSRLEEEKAMALKELGKKQLEIELLKKTRISGTGLENDRSEPEGRELTQGDNP